MSLVGGFILVTAIGVQAGREPASSNSRKAMTAVAKATYIETGLDKRVKKWEKRYLPEPLREYGGWITTVIKIQAEKKITYEWTF